MIEVVKLFLSGFLGGCFFALLGYLKMVLKSQEKFELHKFLKTILIAGLLNALLVAFNIPKNEGEAFLEGSGITALIDFIVKVLVRSLKKYSFFAELFHRSV